MSKDGDYVELFRRRQPGFGILVTSKNIEEYLCKDILKLLWKPYEILNKNGCVNSHAIHQIQRQKCLDMIDTNKHKLFEEVYWLHRTTIEKSYKPTHRAYKEIDNFHEIWSLVRWFKLPSNYTTSETANMAWYPKTWLRKISKDK